MSLTNQDAVALVDSMFRCAATLEQIAGSLDPDDCAEPPTVARRVVAALERIAAALEHGPRVTRIALEPPPHSLCWVGSYLASIEHEGRTPDELAAIDRVSRWLCTRGLSR